MINLDYQSRTPIYEQIVTEIEKYVVLGIFKPKEQIMSIRELAETLGVNPNTVKKAYSELERKGVIQTISTKGNFISDNIDNYFSKKPSVQCYRNEINIKRCKLFKVYIFFLRHKKLLV